MNKLSFAEYIWLDGSEPTQGIRSKGRVLDLPENPQASGTTRRLEPV